MAFPKFLVDHDPNAGVQGPWTFRVRLDPGAQIANASVTVVDALDAPIIGTDLELLNVSFGQIDQDVWGVSFFTNAGSPQFYNLRCRFTTSESPGTAGDITMRLRCAQT